MKKRLISITAAAVMALGALPIAASAEKENPIPFELTRPENVSMIYLDGNDSANTIEIHYSQSSAMSDWSSRKENDYDNWLKEINDLGYDDVWINTQIDWSIDSKDDWHVNEYWTTDGYDDDYRQHLGEWAYIAQTYSPEISMSEWIFRYMGDPATPEDRTWFGLHKEGEKLDGWRDVLKEDQYEILTDDEGNKYVKIDLEKHTIYTRVRWLVTMRTSGDDGKDIKATSDWSDVAAIGKDAVSAEPLKEGDIAAPKISDLKYTDEDSNGFPVIAFKLDVDDTLSSQLAQVSGTQGGVTLEVEARVQGKQDWTLLQGDWIIKAGDMKISLQMLAEAEGNVAKDTPIELRARYCCAQPELDDFYTDYSEVLTFGAVDMQTEPDSVVETSAPDDESKAETTTTAAKKEDKEDSDKCSLCGFCPQPLGLCIFIWIAIIVIIVVIIVVVVMMKKKKENGNK